MIYFRALGGPVIMKTSYIDCCKVALQSDFFSLQSRVFEGSYLSKYLMDF
jgi:hypothetical protein